MQFRFLDPNVSDTMNVFLIIANVINLTYNIPQMIKTYKCKSTQDFSATFLFLRIAGTVIWSAYAIEVDSFLLLINNVVTIIATIFISYYKILELRRYKKHSEDDDIEDLNDAQNLIRAAELSI